MLTKQKFTLEVRNHFNALALTSDDADEDEVEKKWRAIKETYVEASKKVLTTRSPRLLEQEEAAYRAKDKEVKKSARQDKRAFIGEMA